MDLPTPPVPLDNICSTIFNNTLYTYSSSAFQSLSISEGATWSKLPMGVAVTGGVCVQATPANDTTPAALYIVGGTTTNTSDTSYTGLQRFVFSTGMWETIEPAAPVTQSRVYHNAVYLNSTAHILVYAGSRDGSTQPSSQTFTIDTAAPYVVTSYPSIAPPCTNPILLPWTESKAVMLGGGDGNTKVMIFSPRTAWVDSNSTLEVPLKNSTSVKAMIVNGDDKSKTLYTFDMTTSPNSVNRTILIDGNGNPVTNSVAIYSKSITHRAVDEDDYLQSNLMKRGNLTVAEWPAYNGSLAPKSVRNGYSTATNPSGLVIISGGNTDDVLCMFKARDNTWANATAMFSKAQTEGGLGSPVSPASATPSAAPSQSASQGTSTPVPDDTSSRDLSLKILGIVLGSIVGLALILLIVLVILRRRRNKRQFAEAGHQRRASGIPSPEKDPSDFGDIHFNAPGHAPQTSQGSFSSMAILMGKMSSQPKTALGRRKGSNGSDSSSAFNRKYKTAISKPIPQDPMAPAGSRLDKGVSFGAGVALGAPKPRTSINANARRGSTRRSSGWNRYWSGGNAMNVLGLGSKRATYDSGVSARSSKSEYSEATFQTPTTQHSAMPQPLKLNNPPAMMNRVASNSPTISHPDKEHFGHEGLAGEYGRPGSVSSVSSYDDRADAFSSGVPASVYEPPEYTSFHAPPWGGQGQGRGQSSAYSESNYGGPATTANPQSAEQFMSGFPQPPRNQIPNHNSDMSWLNLGGGSGPSRI